MFRGSHEKRQSIETDQGLKQTRVNRVNLFISAILIVILSALCFVLGYAIGTGRSPHQINTIASSANAEPDAPEPSAPTISSAFERKPRISFDAENEEHMEDVENFLDNLQNDVNLYRVPDSITQELIDFIKFKDIFNSLPSISRNSFLDTQLNKYRSRFCSSGNYIKWKYELTDYWSIVNHICLPSNYFEKGISTEFSLYWSKLGYEHVEYEFSDLFPEQSYIRLHEIQFERIEMIRSFLSKPDNLWHIVNLKIDDLEIALEELDVEVKMEIEERINSAIKSANLVLENCTQSLCDIEKSDFSVSNNPMDTGHFVSRSPIKNLIDYDLLLASEIYEIEFFVRRYNEGGSELVVAYRDIMQNISDKLGEYRQ